jgi:long-chain acyl-CoA synthetase
MVGGRVATTAADAGDLVALLSAPGRTAGDRIAVRTADGVTLTHGALWDLVAGAAGRLAAEGVGPGQAVGIACAGPAGIVAYLAVLHAGAVAVPLDPAGPDPDALTRTGCRLLVVDRTGAGPAAVHGATPAGVVVVTVDAADAGALAFGATAVPPAAVAPDALAIVARTSMRGRLVPLRRRHLAANVAQVTRHPGLRLEADDRCLLFLPLHHLFALNGVLGPVLALGASLVVAERAEPAQAARTARAGGATVLPAVPPTLRAWLRDPAVPDDTFATARCAFSGGAPLTADDARAFRARFGVPVLNGYGVTEAGPVVACTVDDQVPREGYVGSPVADLEVRLVDDDGDDVLVDDPGEVWVRGPNVFDGYWDDDDATADACTDDGWFRTGDLGVVDDDGALAVIGRLGEVLEVEGFVVHPREVEEVLATHPAVREAALVGPAPLRALLVAVPGVTADVARADAVLAWCRTRLAAYKCPGSASWTDELPRTPTGRLLRDRLVAGDQPTDTRNPA